MFKSMKGIGAVAGPMGAMFEMMGILEPVLEAFEPILEAVGALFEMMSAEIVPVLIEVLTPLFDAILDMMPFFQILGGMIATAITALLEPLIAIFIALMPVIEPIIMIIIQLMLIALVPLQIVFEIIAAILEPMMPFIDMFAKGLEAISPILEWVAIIIKGVFWTAFKVLVLGIAWLVDIVTLGFAGAVNAASKWLTDIETQMNKEPEVEEAAPTGEERMVTGRAKYDETYERQERADDLNEQTLNDELRIRRGLQMQEGGVFTQPVVAGEAGPEIFYPLDKWERTQANMIFQQEITNDLLTQLVSEKEWKRKGEVLRRGRSY